MTTHRLGDFPGLRFWLDRHRLATIPDDLSSCPMHQHLGKLISFDPTECNSRGVCTTPMLPTRSIACPIR
jgi:hypothetical protein